jgi:hypothetical protein
MTEQDFKRSINKGHELFNELGLSRAFQLPTSLPISSNFNRVALDLESKYSDIFFCGLKENHLNFILKDLTYFQFSRDSNTEVRYAFYPSPFSQGSIKTLEALTQARDKGILDEEAYGYAIESLPTNSRRPILRYEYSAKQYKRVKHPISHLHIGTYGEDRWSFERLVTPYAFCLQVAKMYFGEYWEALTEEDEVKNSRINPFDSYLTTEKQECPINPIDKYCEIEQRHFVIR